MIQMKSEATDHALLDTIYGAAFFGVPSQGMDISSLLPMVREQPNEDLLRSLGKESQILRNQCRKFPKAFEYQGSSEIICFYETVESPTAVSVSRLVPVATFLRKPIAQHNNKWEMKGPCRILVDSSSARHGRHWENEAHHAQAIARTHSELVKFSPHDDEYCRVLGVLKRLKSAACKKIPRRMPSAEGTDYSQIS